LVEAIRPDARLVLVGDPGQLASVEAGAVLGDIVGPASNTLFVDADARARLQQATGQRANAEDPPQGVTVGNGIVVLDRVHRFGGGIAELASAIRRGDAETAVDVLRASPEDVSWIAVDAADPATQRAMDPIRHHAITAAQ